VKLRSFAQVDVFGPPATESPEGFLGNPVAVVVDAEGVTDEQMARIAAWTNLSETTFILPPTDPAADYRLRIFTASQELPFAGHPTLGSARAWLDAGGASHTQGRLVQECAAGLIKLRLGADDTVELAAPPRTRTGPLDGSTLDTICRCLHLERSAIMGHQWCANGPQWTAIMLASAEEALAVRSDTNALTEAGLEVGVIGPYPVGSPFAYEVRAFCPGFNVSEDPVTGSLNAAIAQWLRTDRLVGERYVVSQGTVLGRQGRVMINDEAGQIWVGGRTVIAIKGTIAI